MIVDSDYTVSAVYGQIGQGYLITTKRIDVLARLLVWAGIDNMYAISLIFPDYLATAEDSVTIMAYRVMFRKELNSYTTKISKMNAMLLTNERIQFRYITNK